MSKTSKILLPILFLLLALGIFLAFFSIRNQNTELGVDKPSESDLSFTGQRILNILNRDPEKYPPEYAVKLQSSFPKEDSCQYELQEMTTSNDIDPQSDTEKTNRS